MNQKPHVSTIRCLLIALIFGILLAGSLVLYSYLVEGQTIATRSATNLALPMGMTWLGLFTSAVFFGFRRQWSAATLFSIGFAFLGITGNPHVASYFIASVEMPEQPIAATKASPYRAVVVLGGGESITPEKTEELNHNGERIFSAAQLWHAGLVSSVICTGSDPEGTANPRDIAALLLESVGVPAPAIYKISGENTSQEMLSLKRFIDHPPAGFPETGDIALITSAFHIRRAMRLASAQGLRLQPLPCGYRSTFSPHPLVPTAEAAGTFGSALKENLARIVGR